MQRRRFLKSCLAASVTSCLAFAANNRRAPRILLRSGWQVENIGDIAHTPGLVALLAEHVPDAEVTFWPYYHYLPPEEVTMLRRRFPRLQIVEGKLAADGAASTPELAAAVQGADLFLHGSGPATLGWADAAAFRKLTGKPFGVYGVTYGLYGIPEKATLNDARFVYFRDSVSLAKARSDGVKAPIMEFSPDAAFAADVRDDERARAYLRAQGLDEGKFLVCLPKQRMTPVWLHPLKQRPFDPVRHARNEEMKEHDHAPLRAAISLVVRETGLKVLIGHEDITALPIGRDWLLDLLPADVKSHVVWRDTPWFVDEAISIYGRSAGLFGHEMHSPILCIAQGVPAIVVRWAEQSSKGIMWRDLGLGEWLFDFDREDDVQRLPAAVLALARDPEAARAIAAQARARARARLRETIQVVADVAHAR
ncbi:MAG: polysaccharide pyruvyl transferase family protein [Opitutaceae bacterium]